MHRLVAGCEANIREEEDELKGEHADQWKKLYANLAEAKIEFIDRMKEEAQNRIGGLEVRIYVYMYGYMDVWLYVYMDAAADVCMCL